MSLSKDEASDLSSYVSRLIETEKTLLNAEVARDEAQRQFEAFLHRQQYPQKEPSK